MDQPVGTGSSRKSAINSLIWHIGEDISFVPNKKTGGIIIGSKIAPIFFNTAQDSGALPIEADVSQMKTGDVIKIYPYKGIIKKIEKDSNREELISEFDLYIVFLWASFKLLNSIPFGTIGLLVSMWFKIFKFNFKFFAEWKINAV